MSTVEKLFVQIFERKNSIIQQVKKQTDLYSQHIASKLLIDGIPPPPWIFNPNQPSDVQTVLNKEALLSEILLPRPQPAVHYTSSHRSLYNKPVVTRDNDEIQDIYNYNRRDTGDRQDFAASCHVNNTRSTVNSVPELDSSVNSPPDETETRISNIYTAPDQSLARIQRSRSRQKALELRCSGKAEAKSPPSKKNVFIGSSARRKQSFFGFEKVNKCRDSVDLIDPSVTRNESCGVGRLNKGGDRSKEKSTSIKSSAEAAGSGVGYLELDSCSDSIQKNDSVLVPYDEEFTKSANPINELPELKNTSDAAVNICSEATAEDCWVQIEKGTNVTVGRTSQPSSSQQHCCLNEGPEMGICIHSAEADGGTLADSVQQFDNANHCEQMTKPSEGLALERENFETTSIEEVLPTVSNTSTLADQRDKMSDSSSPEKSLKVNGVHRTTSGKAIIPCPDTCNISHQQRNIDADNGKELIFRDLVKDPLVSFRTNIDNAGSDCVVPRSSDCLIFLEPKQLDFGDLEERNLDKCFSLNLGNRKLQKSLKNAFGSLSAPQITSENLTKTVPQNPSLVEPEISTEVEELCWDSFESTSEEHVNIQLNLKEYSPHIDEHPMLEITQEDSETVPRIQNSNFEHQIDTTQSTAFKCSDTEDHVKCYGKEVCKSPTELQTHESQHRTKGKSKSISASTASKRKYMELDYNTGENDLVICDLFEVPLGNHQNHDLPKPEELKVVIGSQLAKMGSWPRTKSRRTEDQETASCSAPPSYSVRMHYHSQSDHKSIDLEKVGDDVETVMEDACPVNKSTNEDMKQKVAFQLNEEMKLVTKQQNEESALCSGGLNETSSSSNLKQVAVPIPARVSQECLVQEPESPADFENDCDDQDKFQGLMVNAEGLSFTEKTIGEGKSYLAVDGRLQNYLQQSPYKSDLELMGVDQSLPELEGFIIDSHSESEEVEISGNHINFEELDLPRTSIERASILEKICKSASQQVLSTQFSSSFKLHASRKPSQSLPNGVLECIDLSRFEPFNKDADEHNCMDDAKGSLRALMHSDSLPNSESEFGWGSQISYGSPVVGKLWERMSSHTSSSGKTLGSNPEFTCFPIEEDPSVSGENENVGEVSDEILEEIVSSINTSAKREPLADITRGCLNAPSPAPVADKFLSKGCGNSATKEANVCDSCSKAKRKVGNHIREKSLDKKNSLLSFGGNAVKKSEASLNIRFSKANSSCKTSSRKERKKLSEKEPKRNNIVSNVTSFIPLVQQKQAAAQCTGKRDIKKVKALEAAEAAKRLEEKKENERKMRKEALKIERPRLEQENLRQMEFEKKRKEEERKKKDADVVAKKRQREEDEKMDKERKRKRLEEARQQQKNDGKLRLEKVEKAKQLSVIGGNDTKKKEACNESKRSQVLLKVSGDNIPLEKPETKLRPNGFTSHVQDAGISNEACRTSTDFGEHKKTMTAFNKSPKTSILAVEEIKEKSYDISPYQCSDNEEEEEGIPEKKFIPSWASKSYVSLVLPLQQGIDPDTIFPPDSFCCTEEVLHRRKPKHKKLAF